jgi:hypothetical protein
MAARRRRKAVGSEFPMRRSALQYATKVQEEVGLPLTALKKAAEPMNDVRTKVKRSKALR